MCRLVAYTVSSTAQPAPPAHSCSTDLKKNHEIDLAPDARPPEATGNQWSVGLRHSVVSWWQAVLMWAHGAVSTPSRLAFQCSRSIFWMRSSRCSSPTLVLKERIHLDHHEPGVTGTHRQFQLKRWLPSLPGILSLDPRIPVSKRAAPLFWVLSLFPTPVSFFAERDLESNGRRLSSLLLHRCGTRRQGGPTRSARRSRAPPPADSSRAAHTLQHAS